MLTNGLVVGSRCAVFFAAGPYEVEQSGPLCGVIDSLDRIGMS